MMVSTLDSRSRPSCQNLIDLVKERFAIDLEDAEVNIGVAFPHEDGKGFNVMLQALPLHDNGKIVLRRA